MKITRYIGLVALLGLFAGLVQVKTPALANPQATGAPTISWKITNTFLSYTTHGEIAAGMDYLYEGALQTSPSGTTTIHLFYFDPTNVAFEGQGGAVCGYASFNVTCTGLLTRLHVTFNYNANANWADPYFSNSSDFNNNPALDLTYTVVYSKRFVFKSADPTPTSSGPGQVTWFASHSAAIGGTVQFLDPMLLPHKNYLPILMQPGAPD